MATRWLSINDIKLLVKSGLYRLETGANKNDSLIYDRNSGTYVGHIQHAHTLSERFQQNDAYIPPPYIIQTLDSFTGNEWNSNNEQW
ncbi:MAG: hypothetical protein KIS94_06085 [Chitinophagales bacterium]|nr:hypothetical protein [Chitinophagales bacterium]